jgi:O-antigen ligase
MLIVLTQFQQDKFQSLITLSERSSFASRMMIWKSAWAIGSDNWILGIGPGRFQETYLSYQRFYPPYLEWAVPQPHNLYLAFWLQTGLLGLIGFIVLLVSWIRYRLKLICDSSQDADANKIRIILLVMILSMLVHGLIDTPYWKNDLSVVFWLLLLL